jgi:transposase
VDALMDAGYQVHLANTAAIVQYSGLKYSDDDSDAAWLAKLLRLGLLPEGYIYPKEQRAVRDLLRRRSRLVQQHTANVLAVQNLLSRNRGHSLNANAIRRLTAEAVQELLPDVNLALAVQSTLVAMRGQEAAIELLERQARAQVSWQPEYRHLVTTTGIGQVLGLTILLETGPVQRFAQVGNYASYSRLVGSERLSNGLGVSRSSQLRGALQPDDQALLPAQARQDQWGGGDQDRGPQVGEGLLLHAARRLRLRRRACLRLKAMGDAPASQERGWLTASRTDWSPARLPPSVGEQRL